MGGTCSQSALLAVIAALLCACGAPRGGYTAAPPLPADVTARPVEQFYPVRGTSAPEILRSLRQNGPVVNGRRSWGRHDWSLRWSYRYAPSGGVCRMQQVKLELSSVTTMPRWVDRDLGDSALVADWERLVTALRIHENGHRDTAYGAAKEVHRVLRRMTAPGCGLMPARANTAAQEILRRYKDRNREYDEETRGGRTQGAVWPVQGPEAGQAGGDPGALRRGPRRER